MSTRTITVAGKVWKYRIGKNFVVAKAADTGEGKKVKLTDLTGMSFETIERAVWKRYFHVTPKQIATWLSL